MSKNYDIKVREFQKIGKGTYISKKYTPEFYFIKTFFDLLFNIVLLPFKLCFQLLLSPFKFFKKKK